MKFNELTWKVGFTFNHLFLQFIYMDSSALYFPLQYSCNRVNLDFSGSGIHFICERGHQGGIWTHKCHGKNYQETGASMRIDFELCFYSSCYCFVAFLAANAKKAILEAAALDYSKSLKKCFVPIHVTINPIVYPLNLTACPYFVWMSNSFSHCCRIRRSIAYIFTYVIMYLLLFSSFDTLTHNAPYICRFFAFDM